MTSSSKGGGLALALPLPFAVVEADKYGRVSGSGEESTYMKGESAIFDAPSRPAAKVQISWVRRSEWGMEGEMVVGRTRPQ